eukprot:jgi/Ulvmu1/5407/UM022_0202.1
MAPSEQFPRPSYKQLEHMYSQLVAERDTLVQKLAHTQEELEQANQRCEEYEIEQQSQIAAAMELRTALSQFFGSAQPQEQSTPKLGATSLKEDSSWGELESQVSNLRSLWSPGKAAPLPGPGVVERSCRSPLRHSTNRPRPSVNFGARRDPVGSIGELVAKAARDRSARCKANQENTPDLAEHKLTPTRGAFQRRHSSIARSPLSSITSQEYPASAIADPESGYICMHSNMLAWSGRGSSTPCLSSNLPDPDVIGGVTAHLEPHLGRSDDECPKTPDSCHNVAKQVLDSLPPKDGDVEGMESMLAAVIKNAKKKAAEGIAAMSMADDMQLRGNVFA